MGIVNLKINGRSATVDVAPDMPLLYALLNIDLLAADQPQLKGPRFGCGLGQCGACTVIVDGEALRSCITPVSSVDGFEITTLDALGTPENPHPIQRAFIEHQAAQCGYCSNGMIMEAKAFLDANPRATEAEIIGHMNNNLCRCGTHTRILRAIKQYQQEVAV
jgi:aerobic-type carbon monoxide dehydrogenase small subunit (CoxS/CutS family)